MGRLQANDLSLALADPSPQVRARACDLVGRLRAHAQSARLVKALSDDAPSVVEAACYALGELAQPGQPQQERAAVAAVASVARSHPETLCREAAVSALGSLGDDEGLEAVLAALTDKPVVRRRAVIALAAFDTPEVLAALTTAARDTDWQVRQAAEDLLGQRPRPQA
jgi:HEAT repeat protein